MDTSYEPFSNEPEYIQLNRAFVETLPLESGMCIVDVACGTGMISEFIIRRLGLNAGLHIAGLDISCDTLLLAQRQLKPLWVHDPSQVSKDAANRMVLAVGNGDCLPVRDVAADAVVVGNAVHIFPDKAKFFGETGRVLRSGGIVAFNSSFYAGTYVPGTEGFYLDWMKEALLYVQRQDRELRAQGLPGVKHTRKGAIAFSNYWLSPQEYARVLGQEGFDVVETFERTVMMTQRAFETVGAYAGLASVLLSGYPVELSCEALARSVGSVMLNCNLKEVPRSWLEMIAIKR